MERYQDSYGIWRSRGRVGNGSRPGVRNAVYDIWGNLVRGEAEDFQQVGGRIIQPGEQFDRQGPTGIDRWYAENSGMRPGALTPGIERFKRQFRAAPHQINPDSSGAYYSDMDEPESQQLTSWGVPWDSAVRAAKRQKVTSAPYSGSYRD